MAKIEEASGQFTRQSLAKVLSTAANEHYKASIDAQKTFRKEADADPEEYVKQFINSRKQYYELKAYQDIVKQSPQTA